MQNKSTSRVIETWGANILQKSRKKTTAAARRFRVKPQYWHWYKCYSETCVLTSIMYALFIFWTIGMEGGEWHIFHHALGWTKPPQAYFLWQFANLFFFFWCSVAISNAVSQMWTQKIKDAFVAKLAVRFCRNCNVCHVYHFSQDININQLLDAMPWIFIQILMVSSELYWPEIRSSSHVTWLESALVCKFEDLRLSLFSLITDFTWIWLGSCDLRLDRWLDRSLSSDYI